MTGKFAQSLFMSLVSPGLTYCSVFFTERTGGPDVLYSHSSLMAISETGCTVFFISPIPQQPAGCSKKKRSNNTVCSMSGNQCETCNNRVQSKQNVTV